MSTTKKGEMTQSEAQHCFILIIASFSYGLQGKEVSLGAPNGNGPNSSDVFELELKEGETREGNLC